MQPPRRRDNHAHNPNLPATILSAGGRCRRAMITRLWYDGCELSSDETFDDGEKIKIAIVGMGTINAQVNFTKDGTRLIHFLEDCPV